MNLNAEEQAMLDGQYGWAVQKSMQILVALGSIYGAQRLVPIASAQIAGVSYDNLGEAGLNWLDEMSQGGGRVRTLTTLNPAGMDTENWPALGIEAEFARNQERVLAAFARMGVVTTCTCTPYLVGNLPHFGEHIAWAESSAVCFANSVIGARTNREGGPSALAAALTGRTPEYGYHLQEARKPGMTVEVTATVKDTRDFGALGKAIGARLEGRGEKPAVYILGIETASLEMLKSFCASLATYGGAALFHMEGITPEAPVWAGVLPAHRLQIAPSDLSEASADLQDNRVGAPDFFSLGCPHLSLAEIARLAELLRGKRVQHEFWITTARPVKKLADQMGYSAVIEASGAKFAADTCCVVAPIRGRFQTLATDSAKACYYARAKNCFKTHFLTFEQVVAQACTDLGGEQ